MLYTCTQNIFGTAEGGGGGGGGNNSSSQRAQGDKTQQLYSVNTRNFRYHRPARIVSIKCVVGSSSSVVVVVAACAVLPGPEWMDMAVDGMEHNACTNKT